jgi:ketosteroid isomerase-like protein
MSANDVEIVRRVMDAYERGDLEAQLALLHPEVELVEWPAGPDPQTYRGHGGVVRAYESWSEAWESLSWDLNEIVDNSGWVFVALQMRAKGRGSAIEIVSETFNVFTLRDGLITKGQFFTDREEALEAAGLAAANQTGATHEEAR